jgi:predicted anti-sigma-YlaC factor YlaD
MKCNDFNNKLASMKDITRLSPEMHQHMENCASCRKAFQKNEALLAVIKEEKRARVSPYINTRIMAQIEKQTARPKIAKPALVAVMSVILMVLGFLSTALFQNHSDMANSAEVIASDYYFNDNPGAQLEEIWINTYRDE